MTNGAFTVRDALVTDAPALAPLFREPDVVANTYRSADTTPADVLAFLRGNVDARRLVAVAGAEVAGFLALVRHGMPPARHVAEFFVLTAPAWRRRGVARALVERALHVAFREWACSRVELEVLVDNAGAIRLYEDLGFAREGVKRRSFRRPDGSLVDSLVMGLLAEEWSP